MLTLRVFIISPGHPKFAADLSALLKRESMVSVLRSAGPEALEADVVISSDDGARAIHLLPGQGRGYFIVVARTAGTAERIALLDGGFDHVLHGDVPAEEVVAQVRAVRRRIAGPVPQETTSRTPTTPLVLDHGSRQALVFGRRVTLTALEWKLLSVLTDQPGRTFSNRDLMMAMWGSTAGAASTVSAQIRRLRVKIEPDPSNPTLIRTTWGAGYAYQPDATLKRR